MPVMTIRIGYRLVVFDASIVKRRWKKFNQRPLVKAGMLIRRISRGSIRRRKNPNLHSPAGSPPYSHVNGANPPFKQILSIPNFNASVVYIGMRGFGNSAVPVPGLHEHGGGAVRLLWAPVGRRKLKRNFSTPRQGGIIKKRMRKTVTYKPRPFMFPALKKAAPLLPALWANSVR